MSFKLSWGPEGSVGFLINLFGFFELTMMVVRGREVWVPCNDLPNLQRALHQSYNAAANCSVDLSVLNKVSSQATHSQMLFSLLEIQKVLKACSNIFVLGSDYITWWYLKVILANNTCAVSILSLANACLSLHHWPRHFKESVSVIIPKPGKPAYDTPKAFRPIVLLNTLGKLIEKMIAR